MTPLRNLGPRLSYTGWGLVLLFCDVADAVRRRLVFSTAAAITALAVLIVIVGPGAGAGSSAAAEETFVNEADATAEAEPDSAAKERFIEVGGYSISLPDGWSNSPRPPGSAFAATSADGLGTTTLWIKQNPNLDLDAFERRSKRSLAKLGDDVAVLSRVDGDVPADSSVELTASVPLGNDPTSPGQELASSYRVTLRVAGPYTYYLATTIQPGAAEALTADADELSHGLRPWLPGPA